MNDVAVSSMSTALIRRRALTIHAAAVGSVCGSLALVWALTGFGYFWPFWVALPLSVPLGIHAVVETLLSQPSLWRRRGMTLGLAVHIGVTGVLMLFLFGIWLGSTPGGYLWPAWPFLPFLIAVGVHWAIVQAMRIEHLETVRTESVEQQETDLRRIERDLHDGAQARLVALGINLGMAEQKLETDPDAARALVMEARAGVGDALEELRDLVRGIRPPVLADRGLEAAISALADRSPLRVGVTANVDPRPEDPVETGAYFVVAESLTNAAKHAEATRVDVIIERIGFTLRVAVTDDGRGGADPAGPGLAGLRRRVEVLGGTLAISSPTGGPTTVRAEIPCRS